MSVTRYDFRAALLYASTTDSMIPWEWIASSKDSRPPMTERERVETLLRAVSGDRLTVREWTRLVGAPLRGSVAISDGSDELNAWWATRGGQKTGSGSAQRWDDQRLPLLDEARAPLRAALEGLLHEPERSVVELSINTMAIVDEKVIRVTEVDSRGVPYDRVIAHSIGAALIFALTLVLDPQRPYRRLLRRCALPACSRFALGVPPKTRGMPPNFYCSEEHRRTHRRQQANERQAAHREGLPVALKRLRDSRRKKT